jgi:hypothetical protein
MLTPCECQGSRLVCLGLHDRVRAGARVKAAFSGAPPFSPEAKRPLLGALSVGKAMPRQVKCAGSAVNVALGQSALAACPWVDRDLTGEVTSDEIVAAANSAREGCVPTRKDHR